ncbi:MAG TPA: TolC family protein [Candidatus Omnitrophota bacterium]|nr:TolC family protein [Candidatus Omnitrophota bacterium]
MDYLLSLEEATKAALNNNFDVQIIQYDTLISRTQETAAESIYDTVLEASTKYRRDESAGVSTLAPTESRTNDHNIGLSKKLPSGTTLETDWTNNRGSSNSSSNITSPYYDSTAEIALTQELGKNFFGLQDRGKIKITRLEIENAEFTSMDKIEGLITDVQKVYWDLVLQHERVSIEEDMFQQAKRLYDLNSEKFRDGLIEKPELLDSEANYHLRANAVMQAGNILATKESTLELLLNLEQVSVRVIPSEGFNVDQQPVEEETPSLEKAFSNRYDYQQAKKMIEARKIELSLNTNNLWPQIDLEASYARNGIDGGSFKDGTQDISDEDNPDYWIGVSLKMPLENTKERAQRRSAELKKRQAILAMKSLERRVMVDVIDRVRNCNVLRDVAMNQVKVADLQSQKLEAEMKRFNAGRSDTNTVIRFQEDAIQARWLAAQAKFAYYSARIDLRRSEGVLLSSYWDGKIEQRQ